MTLLLKTRGFTVITAENGAEAVSIATEHRPDAIVMDVSMPVMDGVAATAVLKTSPCLANTPVIGLTAHPLATVEQDARAAGMVAVLPKQELSDLIRMLRSLVLQF